MDLYCLKGSPKGSGTDIFQKLLARDWGLQVQGIVKMLTVI